MLDALQVEIRQRTVGQTVAVAARMMQRRLGPVLLSWLVYSLPLAALSIGMPLYLEWDPWWSWIVLLSVTPLFSLPLVTTCGNLVFDPEVSFATIVRSTLRRSVSYLLLFVLLRGLVFIGLFALLVPGLYLWRSSWFLSPIIALEGAPMGASLKRSRRFAAGFQGLASLHALNAAALLVYLSVALAAVIHFMLGLIGLNVAAVGDLLHHELYPHILAMISFSLCAPFITIVWFFVYLEVRTRKEGWDLEIAFREKARQLEVRRD